MWNKCVVATLLYSLWSSCLADQLQDPTRPLLYRAPVANVESVQLNSILIASGRRLAVINGKPLAENDSMDGLQVVRIEKDRVTVSKNGKIQILILHHDIKQ